MTATSASTWQSATVTAITDETPTVKTYLFTLPGPVKHLAGQHYELRLTSEDGYQAARLYSAASPATGSNTLELTIALSAEGEVTPYLYDQLAVGDSVEIRGPLGKFFVWEPANTQPVLLIAGGSGVAPMRCMLQAHANAGSTAPIHLLYSARDQDEIIYEDELLDDPRATITLTDRYDDDWQGATGFITAALIQNALARLSDRPVGTVYVCGSNRFVEAMTQHLLALDIPPARVKAERFGS